MRPQNVHPEDLVRVDQIDLRGDWLSQDPDELELVVVALSGPVIRAARTRGRRSGAAATPSDYRSRVGVRRPREPRLSDRRRLTPVRAMPHKDRAPRLFCRHDAERSEAQTHEGTHRTRLRISNTRRGLPRSDHVTRGSSDTARKGGHGSRTEREKLVFGIRSYAW